MTSKVRSDGTTTRDAADDPSRRLVGIGLMMGALVCFTAIDTSAKWLSHSLPALEVTFFRYLVAFVLSAIVFNPITARHAWRTRRPWLQILRALFLLGSTAFNFMALRHLQLAETMSIVFGVPFMVAVLSGPLLGETVGGVRWAAIAVGFLGVLLVTRPAPGHFDPAMAWAFAAAGCYAGYVLVTRMLSGLDSAASLLLIPAGAAVVMVAPFLPSVWVMPAGPLEWTLLVVTGLAGATGHFLLILAYIRTPASALSPFIYFQIVWMTLSGWLVFGDVPGAWTIAGASVVIASGLWLVHIERGRRNVAAEPTR
ncbi:MAG: DMT family transporter [Siculibacillus sp.]|nr:DMT family transporter [Siculibacillus sp.]